MKAFFLLPAVILLMIQYAFSQAGNLDSTFGTNGKVTTALGFGSEGSEIYSMAVQADGKILAAGKADISGPPFCDYGIARYNNDGSLDNSFANTGTLVSNFVYGYEYAVDVGLQPDHKIVFTGNNMDGFEMARLNVDGSFDTSFNEVVSNYFFSKSLTIQPDGKTIVAGKYAINFGLIRYNAAGMMDSSFGTNGITSASLNYSFSDVSITLQPDGKILAAGSIYAPYDAFVLVRFHSDGTRDSTFGMNGIVITEVNFQFNASGVELQADGKIVVAGIASSDTLNNIVLARYDSTGAIDNAFGIGGIVMTEINSNDGAITLQPDQKIVVCGTFWNGFNSDFELVRYHSDGTPDSTFGNAGTIVTDFDNGYDMAYSVVIDSSGKIVVGGSSNGKFAIARFLSGLNVGVPEIADTDNSISIYPNPSNGIFQIKNSSSPIQGARVFNVFGERVFSTSNFKSQTSNFIDLSNQPEGVYFLHFKTKDGWVMKKVIIN